MATTRFKGESGSDRLGVSTISDSDMIQVRHKPGTVDDADKGVSKAVLNSCPFGVSSTAAATAAKTAALTDSNPDFTLISGREVVVCFSAANSASSPTLNFAGSGAYPMYYPDGTAIGNWDAGTWMHLKYFEATINDTLTQRWIALSPVVTNAITSGDKRPAASGAVANLLGLSNDDVGIQDISNQVTKSLGVITVFAYRKQNMVYIQIEGQYTGTQSTRTQNLVVGLPAKYRPSYRIAGLAMIGYNDNQYISCGRGSVETSGDIALQETAWVTGTGIRCCFTYFV